MLTVIQLTGYRISELNFKLDPSVPETPNKHALYTLNLKIECGFSEEAGRKHFTAGVGVIAKNHSDEQDIESTPCPFEISIKVEGTFVLSAELSEEAKTFEYLISAPSILYGIARTIIVQITSQTNHPHLIFPAVSFYELNKNAIEERTLKLKELVSTAPVTEKSPAKVPKKKPYH